MNSTPDLFLAFFAGLVSFLSPCVLPLVPAYIGYMSGSAIQVVRGTPTGGGAAARGMSTAGARWIIFAHALIFVIGFTVVFVVVIGGLAGALTTLFKENRRTVQYIMGFLLVVFGLHMAGVFNLPFLNYTRRLDLRPARNLGYLRSFLIGLGFGMGWTPCVGPVLSSIFVLSLNGQEGQAFPLFLAYSLGLGVPFLATALATGQIAGVLKRLTRKSYTFTIGRWTVLKDINIISLVSGILLIFMGVLIFTNSLALLAPPDTWFNI